MLKRIRARYRRSWFGRTTNVTNGRTILVGASIVLLSVSVSWLYLADARQARDETRESNADDLQRDLAVAFDTCVRWAEIHQMFLTTFDVVEEAYGPNGVFDETRVRLAERYPAPSVDDCIPPTPGD